MSAGIKKYFPFIVMGWMFVIGCLFLIPNEQPYSGIAIGCFVFGFGFPIGYSFYAKWKNKSLKS